MSVRRWTRVCSLAELEPGRGVAAIVDGQQVALFLLPGGGGSGVGGGGSGGCGGRCRGGEPASHLRAIDNRDPASGANVMSRGILGESGGVDYVASPMYKHRYDLSTGRCLDGDLPGVRVWPVRVWGRTVEVLAVSEAAPAAPPVDTHCPYCALQCAMGLRSSAPDVVEVVARPEFPVNKGRMCIKGWTSVDLISHPDRLTRPLVRGSSGRLQDATWDAALDLVASRVSDLQTKFGAESVGVFGSGALTNEKAYLLGKFARLALRTPHIDYNGRFCMSSAAAAQNRVLGIDRGLPFPLSDLAETDTLVLWGANPADTMPPLMGWVDQLHERGGKLAVVDPRRSATADRADLHVQPVPGTDLAVALGLLHLAAVEGMVDVSYVASRTTGWTALEATVEGWTPQRVEKISGVNEATLRQLLAWVGRVPSSMILTGRGPEQQSKGVDTVAALIALMLALGKVGKPASGYGCLTGQANGQGGREHGQKADQLPGYRLIGDPADRDAVAAVWGVEVGQIPGPGRSATEMIASIGTTGGLRGLVIAGSNLVVAAPDAGRTRDQLSGLDLLVVLDPFASATGALADVVLPVTQWAEEDGTTTNLEGRVLRRRRAVDPPAGVMSDIEVMCALADRLGCGDRFRYGGAEEVFDELRRASAGGRADYSGITYQRLDESPGLFWPCPDVAHPGTPRMFEERFGHPDGLARFAPIEFRPSAEVPDGDFPVYFTTGRYREHYNSGSQTRRVKRLREERPEPLLQIHPDLAGELGLIDMQPVVVESRRGSARFRASIDQGIRRDTVFAPFHWDGAQSANLVTVGAVDPVSGMPEFKVCAARVVPFSSGS